MEKQKADWIMNEEIWNWETIHVSLLKYIMIWSTESNQDLSKSSFSQAWTQLWMQKIACTFQWKDFRLRQQYSRFLSILCTLKVYQGRNGRISRGLEREQSNQWCRLGTRHQHLSAMENGSFYTVRTDFDRVFRNLLLKQSLGGHSMPQTENQGGAQLLSNNQCESLNAYTLSTSVASVQWEVLVFNLILLFTYLYYIYPLPFSQSAPFTILLPSPLFFWRLEPPYVSLLF